MKTPTKGQDNPIARIGGDPAMRRANADRAGLVQGLTIIGQPLPNLGPVTGIVCGRDPNGCAMIEGGFAGATRLNRS